MKKNAVILHGWGNSSKDNWFLWLKKELDAKDWKVWVPDLPDADHPNVCNWNPFLLDSWEYNGKSVVIGHSAGAVEVLSLLDRSPASLVIKKAILVAGFTNLVKKDPMEPELEGLFIYPFDWENIKSKTEEIVLIHSDNDPYVPFQHAKILKKNLDAKLIVMKGQKHFSVSTTGENYKKFPEILELI